MKRWLIALVVLVLVAAACGSDDGDGDTTTAAPAAAATTAAPDAPAATEPPAETQPPAATEAPADTAAPAAEGTLADLAITEVVFGDHVTITNLGGGTVNIDALWLCNRPSYTEIAVNLAPGESQTIDAGKVGGLGANGGEVGLYSSSDFGDSGSMVDYVSWGGAGGRASVATGAGIWPDGDTVATDGAGISAPNGGESSTDWSSQ
jgi:hypothetical protein